jgi:hypothetical protein
VSGLACNQGGPTVQASGAPTPTAIRYGANSDAGGTFTHDGVTLYATFNSTVERFLRTPFVKRDRIGDAFKSFEKLRSLAVTPGR